MNRTQTITSTVALIVAAAVLVLAYAQFAPAYTAGAAGGAPGDFATTTDSSFASATATRQLKSNAGTLGSIVIGSSSPVTAVPQIVVYDATSTMATTSARILAKIGAGNQTAATYEFDAAAAYGLKLEVGPGYNGNATITWR